MTKGVYVENLTEEPAETAVAVTSILQRGARNRHIGATSMNKESSRSHTVFTVTIQTKSTNGGLTKIKTSRLNLVDLAGSERQKAAQTEGQALKEASQINKSLSAIGNVSSLLPCLQSPLVIAALMLPNAGYHGAIRHLGWSLKTRMPLHAVGIATS